MTTAYGSPSTTTHGLLSLVEGSPSLELHWQSTGIELPADPASSSTWETPIAASGTTDLTTLGTVAVGLVALGIVLTGVVAVKRLSSGSTGDGRTETTQVADSTDSDTAATSSSASHGQSTNRDDGRTTGPDQNRKPGQTATDVRQSEASDGGDGPGSDVSSDSSTAANSASTDESTVEPESPEREDTSSARSESSHSTVGVRSVAEGESSSRGSDNSHAPDGSSSDEDDDHSAGDAGDADDGQSGESEGPDDSVEAMSAAAAANGESASDTSSTDHDSEGERSGTDSADSDAAGRSEADVTADDEDSSTGADTSDSEQTTGIDGDTDETETGTGTQVDWMTVGSPTESEASRTARQTVSKEGQVEPESGESLPRPPDPEGPATETVEPNGESDSEGSSSTDSSGVDAASGPDDPSDPGPTASDDTPGHDADPAAATIADLTADQRTTLEEAETLTDAVESEPFDHPEATESALVRAHNKYAQVAAALTDDGSGGSTPSAVREPLETVERYLDEFDRVVDAVETARATMPEDTPLVDLSEERLVALRDRYDAALEAAGEAGFDTDALAAERDRVVDALETRRTDSRRAALVAAVERVADNLGRLPTKSTVVDRTDATASAYEAAFEDWGAVLAATDIDVKRQVVDELDSVRQRVGGPPDESDVAEHSEWDPAVVQACFDDWGEALDALPQLEAATRASDSPSVDDGTTDDHTADGSDFNSGPSSEEVDETKRQAYLDAIEAFAAEYDGVLEASQFREFSEYSYHEVVNEFGLWKAALEAAGVDNRSRIIDEIERVADEIGHPPSAKEFTDHSEAKSTTCARYFESFSAAVEQASLSDGDDGSSSDDADQTKRQAYLDAIEAFAAEYDGVLKAPQFSEFSEYNYHEVVNEFGSWKAALEAAGVDNKSRIIDEIERVGDELGHPPSAKEFTRHSEASAPTCGKYFESFSAAVEQASFPDSDKRPEEPTRADHLETLRAFADEHDGVLKAPQFTEFSGYHYNKLVSEFGSWQAALDEAGVDNRQRLLGEIERVAEELGHVPSKSEMNEHGRVSGSMYTSYFESYSDAAERVSLPDEGHDRSETVLVRDYDALPTDEMAPKPVVAVIREVSEKQRGKAARLRVEDETQTRLWFDIWRQHDPRVEWKVGHWYVLDGVKTKQKSRMYIASTDELAVTHVGTEPPREEFVDNFVEDDEEETERPTFDDPTRSDYLDAIRALADDHDGVVEPSAFDDHSEYDSDDVVEAFGSWKAATDEASIDNRERLLSELERVSEELGYVPLRARMTLHSDVDTALYEEYFRSYAAAVGEVSLDDPEKSAGSEGPDEPGYSRLSDVTDDARLDRSIAVCVRDVDDSGQRKDFQLLVEDLDGSQCRLDIWQKHNVDTDWTIDDWYVLEEARGKTWTTGGERQRSLSSTADLRVRHVGPTPPGDTERESREAASESERGETDQAESESATEAPGEDNTDETTEDGILDEVMSEFDDLPDP